MIVCGRAARWWDDEVKALIKCKREVYKKIANSEKELWEEYCVLHKAGKKPVIEKKLNIWSEVVGGQIQILRGMGLGYAH